MRAFLCPSHISTTNNFQSEERRKTMMTILVREREARGVTTMTTSVSRESREARRAATMMMTVVKERDERRATMVQEG